MTRPRMLRHPGCGLDRPQGLPVTHCVKQSARAVWCVSVAVLCWAAHVSASAEPTEEGVVALDRVALAQAIFSDAQPNRRPPQFRTVGTVHEYVRDSTGEEFQLAIGIYVDEDGAKRALSRGMPSMASMLPPLPRREHFLSSGWLHLRVDNVAVMFERGRLEDLTDEGLVTIGLNILKALDDPEVVIRGWGPLLAPPEIRILSARAWSDLTGYTVVFSVPGTHAPTLRNATALDIGVYRSSCMPFFMDPECTIRVASVGGLVSELPASKFPPEAFEGPEWKTFRLNSLPEAQHADLMERFFSGDFNVYEQALIMSLFVRHPDEAMARFFWKVMNTPYGPDSRGLDGLARLQWPGMFELYREIAKNPNRGASLRSNAIERIGWAERTEDLPLLESLLQESNRNVNKAAREAISRISRATEATQSDQSNSGRLCLAAVPEPTNDMKSLSNPAGGNPRVTYSVQVDRQEPVELSLDDVLWIETLGLSDRHSIVIRADGKRLESFFFRFNNVPFKNQAKPDLCLYLNALYLTWHLVPVEQTGDWCNCWGSENSK